MRGRHKKWAAPYLADHPELVLSPIDPKDPFFSSSKLCLEVGMGKGDFLLGMAQKNPEVHYLGLERDSSIMGTAAKKIAASGLTNIRLRAADFDFAYEEMKSLVFDAIYLNFSDPWPKKRHWKRRLTTKDRLLKMAGMLKENGLIAFKSDNPDLYAFTLEQAPLAGLAILSATSNYQLLPEDVMTEYEKNFRSQGKPITRILMAKAPSPSKL
ncbi:MAG: tRNA (guanine-N(7)-)-methyltransferase [Tenericutes bacterium ADurb.BinA155]|nr:MAG: tRNA (guanine-N(7)-)-methyltransferase [Tenericutes bacterium ADurb.BinA155]